MKKKIYPIFLLIAVVLFFSACIKDTDFDQTEEIEISPTIELDFLFFNLHSQSFIENGVTNLVISDTTNFNFLNDDFVVDHLERAEFFFKNTNSIPAQFTLQFEFLNENNELQYEVNVPINAGSITNPVISEQFENIEGDDIISLTLADKVVLTITALSSVDDLDGTLKLQSKTTYYLKIVQ